MEYFVAISADSPFGALLLADLGKIGGASTTLVKVDISHPVIVCRDIDWTRHAAFVAMTHLRNPGAPDPLPREIVVPCSAILLVAEVGQFGNQQPAAPQSSPSALH